MGLFLRATSLEDQETHTSRSGTHRLRGLTLGEVNVIVSNRSPQPRVSVRPPCILCHLQRVVGLGGQDGQEVVYPTDQEGACTRTLKG